MGDCRKWVSKNERGVCWEWDFENYNYRHSSGAGNGKKNVRNENQKYLKNVRKNYRNGIVKMLNIVLYIYIHTNDTIISTKQKWYYEREVNNRIWLEERQDFGERIFESQNWKCTDKIQCKELIYSEVYQENRCIVVSKRNR